MCDGSTKPMVRRREGGMPNGNCEFGKGATDGGWLEDTLRPFNFVATLRERRQIRRFCDESLKLYRQVEAQTPHAPQSERYARFIELRSGASADAVPIVMRRAEESFADWPTPRPLNFRDVVQYLAVTDCLKIDIAVAGVRSRIVDFVIDIVADVIPRDL